MSTDNLFAPDKTQSSNTKNGDLLRDLRKKRGVIRGRLTLFTKYINNLCAKDIASDCNKANELQLRIDGALAFFKEFNIIQSEIEVLDEDDELIQQLELRENFESAFYAIMAQAKSFLSAIVSGDVATSSSGNNFHNMKLPTLNMPQFDGSCETWIQFRDVFSSLVHSNKDIAPIQKFHYLKSSLKGVASLVIDSLEFSSNNYAVAWDLLCNRYNNTRLLVHSHVKALFSIQSISKESPSQIRKLIDTLLKNLRALKLLNEPVDSWDTLIIYMVVSKLDSTTEREWEQFRGSIPAGDSGGNGAKGITPVVKLDHLIKFLNDRADMLETLMLTHSSTHKVTNKAIHTPNKVHCHVSPATHAKANKSDLQQIPKKRYVCLVCSENHPIYACQKFNTYSLADKLKFVRHNNLCQNCLRAGHPLSNCRFGSCRICNARHHTIIHDDQQVNTISASVSTSNENHHAVSATNVNSVETSFVPSHDNCTYAHNAHLENQHLLRGDVSSSVQSVLLSTALVEIASHSVENNKHYHVARVLLDCGSEKCFITKRLCDLLNIPTIQSTIQIKGVGNSVTNSTHSCNVDIKALDSAFVKRLQCLVLPEITSSLPPVTIRSDMNQFQLPDNVRLADPTFLESRRIDILIGADIFWDLLCDGRMRLKNGPFLQNTRLGWIISGPIHTNIARREELVHCNFSQSIDDQLRMFWELEELPKTNNLLSDDDAACEKHFIENTKRMADGRFCVKIPFKQSPNLLGDTYYIAKQRFLSLERRLQKTPQYKGLYVDFMREYLRLGHMSRVHTYGQPYFILTHHGVFTSNKMRVVFNASQKSSTNVSLNDLQFVGSPIQGDLISILLRFRQYKFVVCADIEKAYRQCLVDQTQRELQMILWRENPEDPVGIYQLNTVTYGFASSAFLMVRCLKQLASECNDPEVQRVINEDFYVDDLITGSDSIQDILRVSRETERVLATGCFPLRKWIYNFNPNKDQLGSASVAKNLSLGENVHSRTLGLGWCNNADFLFYRTELKNDQADITKRFILSSISQIFDPLGLLSPTIMIGKILLQKLWLLKLDWDEPVPSDIARVWKEFEMSLTTLNNLRIPRHAVGDNPSYIELHLFNDASQVGYGTCAYIRTVNADNSIDVRLLCSKGKVAPIKAISIPRAELCSALLSARLYKKIAESLRCHFRNVVFWTDSTIVLGWLRMVPNLLKTFVQARTVEILELTAEHPWRHVHGKDNPADLVSRGMSLNSLAESNLWWNGPAFLYELNVDLSNAGCGICLSEHELPEVKNTHGNYSHSFPSSVNVKQFKFPFDRFSHFDRMIRCVARLKRVAYNKAHPADPRLGSLSVRELRNSLDQLVRFAQSDSFSEVHKLLVDKKSLPTKHSLSNLNVFLDSNLIIRVGGRLGNSADFNFNKRYPILLSSKHHFTILLFRREHKILLHAAPLLLLYKIREDWWPIGGRNLARKIVHACVLCTRLRGRAPEPIMGNLPKERLNPGYPYMFCGVDYAGPVFVLNKKGRGAKTSKAYICLFVCFATRAIHLEFVSDLTTEAYLLALKRFISRRGKPSEIFSDNGKCFVGLRNEFSKFLETCSKEILDYATSQDIKFKFNPPYAAHFGGIWESGVKSCKYHLRRVVGNAHLTFEEFTTVLAQIEAVLNSRPLTPMSSDPHDLQPLSPAHFLIGRPLTSPVFADVEDKPAHTLTRYQRVEQMRQHFWRRWSKEYVSELQTRAKWKSNKSELKQDTLVVIKDDKSPPLKWQLGRIVSVFPGRDGVSRVADIRTASGVVRRAFSKICPLPVQHEEENFASES